MPSYPPYPPSMHLLAAVNAARRSAGIHEMLMLDERLASAARGHARHMAEAGELAHQGIGDGTMTTRIAAAGYRSGPCGECVARGSHVLTSEEVVRLWMGSPPHREIICGPYWDFGGGLAIGTDGLDYWCCDVATPAGSRAQIPPASDATTIEPVRDGGLERG